MAKQRTTTKDKTATKKPATKSTATKSVKTKAATSSIKSRDTDKANASSKHGHSICPPGCSKSNFLVNAYYAIWSIVGLLLIILVSIAVFGADSWSENLNLKPTNDQPAQQEAPQQPQQPTEEELDCVAEELGEERLEELEMGAPAEGDEQAVIEECLGF